MQGAKLLGERRAETADWPDPEPSGDEVVVEVKAAAICGSDLHGLYQRPDEHAFVPGHEGAGVVAAVDKPKRVKIGDRVSATAFHACGACDMCRSGSVAYCRDMRGIYGFTRNGVHAQRFLVPESSLLALPDSVSFEAGCLVIDPIGTPYHALRRMGTNATHTVGVFGLGPMGLGAVLVAAHLGAEVIGVDPIPFRREHAEKIGAAHTLDPAGGDVVEMIFDLTKGHGLDRALECSGRPEPLKAALDLARPFAHVSIIGENFKAEISPSEHFLRKEVTLSGSTCFPLGEFGEIVRMIERGLAPERLITHRFGVEDATEAYRVFDSGETGKVLFVAD